MKSTYVSILKEIWIEMYIEWNAVDIIGLIMDVAPNVFPCRIIFSSLQCDEAKREP